MSHKTLPYQERIAARIREGVESLLPVSAILNSISHMQYAPKSYTTLYKIYGEVLAESEYAVKKEAGTLVRERMKESDKILEMYARSRLGFNPTNRVEEVDGSEPDMDNDPISILMEKLGKSEDKGE
jgi:hypothetical protein